MPDIAPSIDDVGSLKVAGLEAHGAADRGGGDMGGVSSARSMFSDVHNEARRQQREEMMEQLKEAMEEQAEVERSGKAEMRRIAAPTARAGYLVAGIIGLFVFWFVATYVFNGNKIAIGVLIIATALFFLAMLKHTLDKKGSRYIAETGGAALGLV